MTQEEYLQKCDDLNRLLRSFIPDDDGWRWCLAVRNEKIDKWATGSNMNDEGTVELFEAALRIRKFGAN